ncbi:MAG: AMP-binding protein, partial [Bacteroidota bacterium]|nr:AMP-binding protein [Bacteroidota bacterium]
GYTPTGGLKSVLLGGGFFNNDLIANLLDKKWPIIKVYGSTESSSLISAHRVKKDDHLPSAGKAVLENKIAVYNKAGDAVPADTEGEIVLSGPVVTNGYLNNMEETARKFRNGCYFSGDYGYLDNDGYLYLVTRREDLIISGGENINPAEIEYLLSKYSPIAEMVVFAEDDKYWGQIPALAVRLRDPKQNITLEEINLFLKDKLASYKFPKKLYIVDEFPKTDLGKVLKKQLISSILE